MITPSDIPTNSSLRPPPMLEVPLALAQADALLHCASAVAYESADQHRGQARQLALAVVHLVDMARVLVIQGLDANASTDGGKAAEADD